MELRTGGKRVNIKPKLQSKKRVERLKGDDRISWLPDEVLVLILSRLPLKDAGRTSVLSSRWINLWKYIFCLNFDAESELENLAKNWKQKNLRHVKRCKYINWVNSVIRSRKDLTLEEFRICFDLDKSSHKAITHWLEFAFSRKVERLALELVRYNDIFRNGYKTYVFPVNFLSRMTGETSTVQRQPRPPIDVNGLKSLCLKSVDVTDEAIEFFLYNCPLLEQLIVHDSSKLSKLIVHGAAPMLKHLEILDCFRLTFTRIFAPSLISLKLSSVNGLLLGDVPMLVDVSIYGVNDELYERKFLPTILGIPQLESLTMWLYKLTDRNKAAWTCPELPNLTKLEIIYVVEEDESLMGLTSFMEASPYLQEFTFQMQWCRNVSRPNRELKRYTETLHQHLRVFKFLGYYGRPSDVEFIAYVLGNSPVLEKIIIDPHMQSAFPHRPLEPYEVEAEKTSRICAELLSKVGISDLVELVIL